MTLNKAITILLLAAVFGLVSAKPGHRGYLSYSTPYYSSYGYYPSYGWGGYGWGGHGWGGNGHGLYSSYSYPYYGYGHGYGYGGWYGDYW